MVLDEAGSISLYGAANQSAPGDIAMIVPRPLTYKAWPCGRDILSPVMNCPNMTECLRQRASELEYVIQRTVSRALGQHEPVGDHPNLVLLVEFMSVFPFERERTMRIPRRYRCPARPVTCCGYGSTRTFS